MAVLPRQQLMEPPTNAYCAESNKAEILGVTGSLFGLAIVIVLLRMHVRANMIKSIGADDYIMLTALLMAMATYICMYYETKYAAGKHGPCIAPEDMTHFGKWQYYHSIWVMLGVVLVKISIAMFLMRLVPPGKNWKRFLRGSIIFLVAFALSCLGTLIFYCTPVAAAWDYSLRKNPGTHCFSNHTFMSIGLLNSSINVATDFVFAILPVPIVIRLQVNRRTKGTLAGILSLGYVACAAGIVKAVKQSKFFKEKDPLWHNDFNVWNMIELCVGISAASLATLRPLFSKALESTKSALSSSNKLVRSTGGFSGYRRQRDPNASRDIKLQNWQDTSNSSGTRTCPGSGIAANGEPRYHSHCRIISEPKATMGMTARRPPSVDMSWEDIHVMGSNRESQEALHRPAGIYKSTQITRTCERARYDGTYVA